MTTDRRFYVYAYLREDGTPYYIGKGTGKRAWRHRKAERVQAPVNHERILLLQEELTSKEACEVEIELIEKYGRKSDGGILVNWTAGGDGLSEPDEEVRRKMSEWERTPELRAKLSEIASRHMAEEAARYGVDLADFQSLSRKARYLLKAFVAKHPEVSFKAAMNMSGKERTMYAAQRDSSKAKRAASRAASGVFAKVAAATRARAPKYNWVHPEHGFITCAVWELVSQFSEQNLTGPNLSKVANGQRRRCKGWELAA